MKSILLSVLTIGVLQAQSFTRISVDDGLSQSVVQCMLQDAQGFMWFGTKDGLNQYDGISFRWWKHDPKDSNSLPGNSITALHQAKDGRLWIGTESDGLAVLDLASETIRRFSASDPSSISHNMIRGIVEDSAGHIWVATQNGLNRFIETGFERYFLLPGSSNAVSAMYVDGSGILWAAMEGRGLFQFNVGSAQFEIYWRPPAGIISCLFTDRSGRLWVGTFFGGLYRRSGDRTFEKLDALSSENIVAITEASNGSLAVASFDDGLVLIDDKGVRRLKHRHDDASTLSSNSLKSMVRDRGGILWVGTNGFGLNKLDASRKFSKIGFDPGNRHSLSHSSVRSILPAQDGSLWIGSYGGIDIFNPGLEKIDHLDERTGLSSNTVYAIIEDPFRPLIWIGSDGGGLSRLDVNTRRIKTYHRSNGSAIIDDNVRCLLIEQGRIIVGTTGGLCAMDPTSETFSPVPLGDKSAANIPMQIRSIMAGAKASYWIATNNGVYKLSPENKVTGHYTRSSVGLGSDDVLSIYPDSNAVVWVGTNGGGLSRLHADSLRTVVFTENEGLPNNVVYGILADRRENLWLSTNGGIVRMEPASATFKPYGVEDGLLSREFNAHAYAAARDGRLYFGGILGVNFFNPDSMPANTHAPDVVLTEIHLFGKTLALKPAVGWRDRIDLEYDQNHVGLSFAALDFTSPRHNRYAYRLLEVDRDWNDAGTTRSATYAYLSPGEYVFEVKASNNDGVWNPEPARLTIVIHPPFWATWYFRITVLVVVLLLLRAGYRRRIQSIKAREKYLEEVVTAKTAELRTKNEELQKANHLKNEFLGIAAHDLRNPLNAIVGYADLMREDVIRGILKPDHLHDLAQIVKSSRDMAALIEDLLNVSAIESGDLKLREHPADLIGLLENCVEKYKRVAARKNIRVEFKPDVRECMVHCDAIRINEVVDNLLSNAVKFTFTGGAVALVTETMPQHVHIHVQDGGPGLKDSDFQFLFSSFKKLSARPTGGESSTGLGLAIVKKIVELHGGRVWAVNRPNAGAQFSFSLERSANRQSPAAGF